MTDHVLIKIKPFLFITEVYQLSSVAFSFLCIDLFSTFKINQRNVIFCLLSTEKLSSLFFSTGFVFIDNLLLTTAHHGEHI